jgi:hypothetical protein
VDPPAAGPDTQILGYWVLEGQLRPDMGAFCVREVRQGKERKWASVYNAVPYLSAELLRNLARYAGVHIYRDASDILFADRHFVALHTGKNPATDTLRLPRRTPVYDVFERKVVAEDADQIPLNVPLYSTALYYLGDPERFRAAVER